MAITAIALLAAGIGTEAPAARASSGYSYDVPMAVAATHVAAQAAHTTSTLAANPLTSGESVDRTAAGVPRLSTSSISHSRAAKAAPEIKAGVAGGETAGKAFPLGHSLRAGDVGDGSSRSS
ncbi:MAG: hypothetical protein QOJ35_4132 [Solirubrobacteraceae bacterium]|nr:hypothetical protein [Solirubrobacteraceae bacterium]